MNSTFNGAAGVGTANTQNRNNERANLNFGAELERNAPTARTTDPNAFTAGVVADLNRAAGGSIKYVVEGAPDTRELGNRIFVDQRGNISRVALVNQPGLSRQFTNDLRGQPLIDGSPTGIQDARPTGIYHNAGLGNYGPIRFEVNPEPACGPFGPCGPCGPTKPVEPVNPTGGSNIKTLVDNLNFASGSKIKLVSESGFDTREAVDRIFVGDDGNVSRVVLVDNPLDSAFFTEQLRGTPIFDGSPTGVQDANPRGIYHDAGFGKLGSLRYDEGSDVNPFINPFTGGGATGGVTTPNGGTDESGGTAPTATVLPPDLPVCPTPFGPLSNEDIQGLIEGVNQASDGQVRVVFEAENLPENPSETRVYLDGFGNISRVSVANDTSNGEVSDLLTDLLRGQTVFDGSPTGIQDARPTGIYQNAGFGNLGPLSFEIDNGFTPFY